MAKNDTVLLDAIIEARLAQRVPSAAQDEVFEFFAFEQLLKDYDLSPDEIETGWIDGRDDGGVDGAFLLVNGHLVRDTHNFTWPRRNATIELWLISCKHHDTFLQAPINSLLASMQEILDLGIEDGILRGSYSESLRTFRSTLRHVYRKLAASRPTLSIRLAYASRGDTTQVAENVRSRAEQLVQMVRGVFSSCEVSFSFVGAAELVALHRRVRRFSLPLRILESLAREQAGHVVLVRLADYYDFLKDESGALRRYLFDSNVRDYLGSTPINEGIADTLREESSPDFWWLNNGVTILTTNAHGAGKIIEMEDIQIVNGLQTSESIFAHFQSGGSDPENRAVLVKILVSDDTRVRDQIIRATNSQSVVETSSLRATDKIQRDIEAVLERHDWYYERRKNYYRNIGKPTQRFVTPLYIAAGYVSLVMKNPAAAAKLKSRFLRNEEAYALVFSDRTPIEVWPKLVDLLKRAEDGLQSVRGSTGATGERFLARWRSLIAFLAVSKKLGTFAYRVRELIDVDVSVVDVDAVGELWTLVVATKGQRGPKSFQNVGLVYATCLDLAKNSNVSGIEVVGKRSIYSQERRVVPVSDELIEQVDAALPQQPWSPSVHHVVAAKLGLSPTKVHSAIQVLISRGRRHRQEDGVVYDASGQMIATDGTRMRSGQQPATPIS